MANTYNKYQLKRTSVSGRTPNTTSTSNSSFLDTAELALNLTDKKMFSSNGTALFEIGANLSSISVTGNTIFGNTTINGFANITGTLAAGNTTITGLANVTTLNSGNVTVTGVANVTGNVSVTDTMFGNNVVLTGNLTVSGTTTYINTVTLNVGDNIVTLNADWPIISPTENAGIEVNRGSLANVQFVWDETNDRWTTNSQPMFIGGTLAAGNTTVTGSANVSTTLNVIGAATVNGALVVNNTAALGNTTVTGFANVSSFLNVVGAATVNGALVVNNTAATGNLTVTGFANVSSLNITGAATVNGAVTINNTAAFGNTTITGFVNVSSYGTFGGTVNATALNVGANVRLSTTSVIIGNTTVNTSISATAITSNATLAVGNTTVTGFITTTGTANVAALNVGANVNLTTSSITVGNSTVNTVHNQTNIVIGNTTVNTSISATAITSNATLAIGNTTVTGFITSTGTANVAALNVGANVNLTTSSITVGNSTVNAVHNQTSIVVGNTTVNTSIGATAITSNATLAIGNTTVTGFITSTGTANVTALNVGANVNLTTSSISIGNSTVNTQISAGNVFLNGSLLTVGNTTVNTSINNGTANISTLLNVGANVNLSTTQLNVGNTTVNAVLTSTSLVIANSANVTTTSHEFVIPATGGQFKLSRDTFGNSQGLNFQSNGSGSFLYFNSSTNNAKPTVVDVPTSNTTADIYLDLRVAGVSKVKANSTIVTITGAANVTGPFTVSNTTSLSGNTTITGSANVSTTLNVVGAATVNGALTINNTAALGNTTITGSANVSTTLNVVGAATVNGALTVNNTAALGNTTITGFANASSLNVVGAAVVNGAFTVNNTASVGNTTITGFANVSSTLNVVGAATVNGALTVNNTAAFGNTTITGTLGTGNTTITGSLTVTGNTTANNIRTTGSVQIDGNLTVSGNTISIGVTNLSISDNLISLNEPETATITTATSNATSFIYTANNGFYVGQVVTVSGMTPAGYNVTSNSVTFANATTFAVANTVAGPGAYVSGGTAAARVDTNPDIGFTGNYNDGTYRHAGFFRDATDGVFKVFDQYLPEPTGAFIDTSNTSFRIADFQSNNTVMGSANVAGTTRLGVSNANYLQVVGAASAGVPTISAQGTDVSIDIGYATKSGANHYFRTNGTVNQFVVAHTGSAVNYLQATGAATGTGPTLSATGSDTNVDFNVLTKGTGAVYLKSGNGTLAKFVDLGATITAYPTFSGSQYDRAYIGAEGTATNIAIQYTTKGSASHIFATTVSGTQQFAIAHTASAVNYLQVTGGATGGAPYLLANGSDTNVNAWYGTKGAGYHSFFTNSTGSNIQFLIAHTASAVNYAQVTGAGTGSAVSYTATGTDANVFSQYRTKGTGAHDFYTNNNIQFRVADSGVTNANYVQVTGAATAGIPIIQATGSDANVNFGVSAKNTASIYFYTNNGAAQFEVSPTASAVNRLYVTGGATGVAPKIVATGSDANVSIAYTTKGTGSHTFSSGGATILLLTDTASAVNYAQIYPAATGAGPTINWTGSDAAVVGAYNTKGAGAHFFYTNSNPQFRIADTASAVNYVQITGAATAAIPTISAQGSDASPSLGFTSKASGSLVFFTNSSAQRQFRVSHTASAVNYIDATGSATTQAPVLSVVGTDTNIDFGYITKGTGAHVFSTGGGQQVRINNATTTGAYTLFDRDNVNNAQMLTAANTANMYIQATGGGAIRFNTAISSETQVAIERTASAVNFLRFTGSATGSAASISALGADANVGVSFAGKGSGTLNLNSNTTFNANTLLFTGSNTAITLRVADNGVLSFEGGAGQLFSIANNLTGQIFAVNDISGIPSLEVYSNGQVNVARYGGNVSIGTSTSTLTVNGAVSFGNAVTFSNTIAVTGTATFSNTIVANGALTLSSTGAALTLSNTSSAFINFGAGGYAAPSVGTRSTGAKIVLFNQLSATAADYAIGVEGTHMWFGTDSLVSGYKWYANTTNIMTSNTTGLNIQSGGLSIGGTSAIDSSRNGSFANVTIAGNLTVSGTTTYINTTTLNIGDNIITLNADLPGASAPTENAGIEINRGSSANVSFIWDETNDVWASQINGVSKLTVANAVVSMTGNTYLFLGSYSGEGGELVFANTTGGGSQIIDVDSANDWRHSTYSTTSNIKFNTGLSPSTTKLQVSANGNIGIGNTTPTEALSVTGTAQVTNSTASVFYAAANGNIGIGTVAPVYPLHIQRNANTAVAEIRVDNANTGSSAQARLNLVTASAFSYALHALSDGPTPSYSIGTGQGVTGGITISAANAALTLAANNVVSLKIFANNNIAIGANSTPTEKLRVEGTLSHLGLVPSTGTGIDQIFTATPSITLNTTWQSTGVTSTSLANGSYMVQLFANDIAAGGTANNEYYTGMMSWYSADTNSTVLDEIPLHRAGVSGSNNAIFLATQRTATANTSDLLLMISSAANNSSASTYTIKFRRMI